MGWRADQAYEEENRRAFKAWKATLSGREHAMWQWGRWRAFLAGVMTASLVFTGVKWLFDL